MGVHYFISDEANNKSIARASPCCMLVMENKVTFVYLAYG